MSKKRKETTIKIDVSDRDILIKFKYDKKMKKLGEVIKFLIKELKLK